MISTNAKKQRCPTCGYIQKRSNQANRRYWKLLSAISQGIKLEDGIHSSESWHIWAKLKWLGADDFRLPSGEVIIQPRSTADLDVAQFNVYVMNVESWAAEHGIYLEELEAA